MAYVVAPVAEEIAQFSDEVKMRLLSQLVLQKLIKYFIGTDILASFTLPVG